MKEKLGLERIELPKEILSIHNTDILFHLFTARDQL